MKDYFKSIFAVILLAVSITCSAQSDVNKQPFRASLVYASYNLSTTPIGDVLPTNGGHISFGLNGAWPFKGKFVLGLLFDFRGFKVAGSNWKHSILQDDINNNIITGHSNSLDSVRTELLLGAFNDNEFWGSYLTNWGIMFSPFPNKYGGFMLVIKKGFYTFPIYGAMHYPDYYPEYTEWISLDVPVKLNIQLVCKPASLFIKPKENNDELSFRNNFLVSIFYERISLNNSTLDNESLSTFLDQPFFDKHGLSHQYGFKISFGIY
ncbi:MAG: hypothetical protein HRT71_18400 [Flavobacteriales bacterium]|nr:hypothetical protein [Flavobacteriales bacterium]